METITHTEYHSSGLIVVHDDPEDNFYIDTIRAGLVWPTASTPGYFCMIGQVPEYNDRARQPLVLLSEHVSDLPDVLLEKIKDEITRLKCRVFYMDVNEKTLTFIENMENYLKKFFPRSITIEQPYLKDWINGVLSAQQWARDKALRFTGESILRNQLKSMVPEDKEESKRGPLYAIDAFRCVLGSFELQVSPVVVIKQSGYVYT